MLKYTKLFVTMLVAACAVAPVSACINDRDTFRNERQFKALYPDPAPSTPQTEASPVGPYLLVYGGGGLGLGLLGAAGFFGLVRRPSAG